jgi:hypothetical protein
MAQAKIFHKQLGRAMAQASSRWPFTVESQIHALVNPCGISGGQSDTATGFSQEFFNFSAVNIIPPSFSMPIYHLGDEQYVR